MTIRTMYDAIRQNVPAIPADADLVAGYVDGLYAWTPADYARFPHAAHVRICVTTADPSAASVCDRETNALSPAQAREFTIERNNYRPGTATVYVDWANLPQQLRVSAGLSWDLWLAWYIGHQPSPDDVARVESVLPAGVRLVAWQYRNAGPYDISAVLDDDWHREPR